MGIIENSVQALAVEHVTILTALFITSIALTFAVSLNSNQKDIYSIRNGKKVWSDETILVGRPDGTAWPWLTEMRAKLRYMRTGHSDMYVAFKRHSGRILRAPLADYSFFVLPPEYMEELKSLPTTTMSSSISVEEYLLGGFTTMKAHEMLGDITWTVLRNHLTQKLGNLVEPLADAGRKAFRDEMPDCAEWTSINVHDVFLQIVGRMTGRIFVGEELSTNRLFLDTYINFATCVFVVSSYLKVLPALVRPFVAPMIPEFWKIKRIHANNWKLLAPVVKAKMREPKARAEERQAAGKGDMLDWLLEASGPNPKIQNILTRQLGIGFAAIHTTTNHMTNCLYDLAYRWDEYAPPLIAEYREALRETDGVLQKTTLSKLSKLDSFMKESMRLNPPSSLGFNRKVLKDYTLSDGKVLPKSCWIAVPAGPLMLTQSQFPNPQEFDGFRYHRMRQEGTEESKTAAAKTSQFTSTGQYSLVFGHGRFACPGRFYAGLESKLMLIHVLENYELKLPVGTERPKNLQYADAGIPDPTKHVLFRKL